MSELTNKPDPKYKYGSDPGFHKYLLDALYGIANELAEINQNLVQFNLHLENISSEINRPCNQTKNQEDH